MPHILLRTLGIWRTISILGLLPLYRRSTFKPAHPHGSRHLKFRFSCLLLIILYRIFWISLPPVIIATAICPHDKIHTSYVQKVVGFLHVDLQFLLSQTSDFIGNQNDCITVYHIPVTRQDQGPWSRILTPPSQCCYSKNMWGMNYKMMRLFPWLFPCWENDSVIYWHWWGSIKK